LSQRQLDQPPSAVLAEALAQAPLVLVTLLAGWAIARRTGWEDAWIGRSTFVSESTTTSLRDFGLGFLLAAPWAFGNIATGPFEEDNYQVGWLVLAAFRPGVAEEAWGRVFVIAALYWAFRRYAQAQPAILAAAVLGTYWFAFIHVPFKPGDGGAFRRYSGAADHIPLASARPGGGNRLSCLPRPGSVSRLLPGRQ
jgi:hypothetical protein